MSLVSSLNDLNSKAKMSTINFANVDAKVFTNNNKLGDFFRKNDLEQGTILLQNITVSKKNFNYNIFKRPKRTKNLDYLDEEEVEEEKKRKEQELKEKNNINLSDPIFQYYNIRVDKTDKLLGDTDYYREIIKEKLNIESGYRNEYIY